MNSDDPLRSRLDELRKHEWHEGVPPFTQVLRPRQTSRQPTLAWLAVPALALASLAWMIWFTPPSTSPDDMTAVTRLPLFEDETWSTPSDALLADNTAPENDAAIDGLTLEINQLLKP